LQTQQWLVGRTISFLYGAVYICTYTFARFLPETQQSMINRRGYRCRCSRLVFQAQYPSVTYWYMKEWSGVSRRRSENIRRTVLPAPPSTTCNRRMSRTMTTCTRRIGRNRVSRPVLALPRPALTKDRVWFFVVVFNRLGFQATSTSL
jgi:hypothetical protein